MLIYKLLSADEWRAAQAAGRFAGSAVDHADGYIHFSAADQVVETATRHFAGRRGLVLLAVDAGRLGEELRWEPSRGGALFPHLYADLPLAAVTEAVALPDDVPVDQAVAQALSR
jgi:uncharacterized protein (DUF952 family)